ncbi:hypothetical protein HHI36_008390 [Cryptolaemus montrouzieri]|uniref:Uncharacterized protein n=1 Tax=Cryptolaemus montrouzieri TaxID=559131 RepID=A0ABD2MSK1_9CUCU
MSYWIASVVKQDSASKITDVRAMRRPECGTDHYLLLSKVYFPYRKSWKEHSIQQNNSKTYTHDQYNLEKLENDSIKFSYQLNMIHDRLRNLQQQTPNDIYKELKVIIHEAAHEVLGEKPMKEKGSKATPPWWNNDLEKVVMKKKEAYSKWLSTKTVEEEISIKTLDVEFKKTSEYLRTCSGKKPLNK